MNWMIAWTKIWRIRGFSQTCDGMSISEYIASFVSMYRKIEKLKMTLPSEILAFKLLRKANISKEEIMLVLTGLN